MDRSALFQWSRDPLAVTGHVNRTKTGTCAAQLCTFSSLAQKPFVARFVDNWSFTRSSSVFLDSSLARSAFTKIYRNNRDLNNLAQFLIHFSNFEKFYRKFVWLLKIIYVQGLKNFLRGFSFFIIDYKSEVIWKRLKSII